MSEEPPTNTEDIVENADSTAVYQAVVTLPDEINVLTGEENDEVVYKVRSRLYRFATESKEWKERGTGDIKLLKNRETKLTRLVLRQEKTNKLVLNHFVNPLAEIKPNAGSDTSWVWAIEDFAESPSKVDTFAIRFKTTEIAEEFKKFHDAARESNLSLVKKSDDKDVNAEVAKTLEKTEDVAPAKSE